MHNSDPKKFIFSNCAIFAQFCATEIYDATLAQQKSKKLTAI